VTILETVDLRKRFGDFFALNGVNLKVQRGQIHGFIGPNGAGKTTTMRILLGLLKATSGTAQLFGKDAWADAVEIHKLLAYVPGEVNLWPNLTGGEVLDLFARLRGRLGQQNQRLRKELIERFELDPSRKCGTYSKGNRQKVALIAALASGAELLILDEPTSGLDPLMEQVFQDCIGELKSQGRSVLLSSHILSEVEKTCDYISIIRDGVIIENGTLEELRHLTSTHVAVQTKRPIQRLQEFPGVHDLREEDGLTHFSVEAEHMGTVMAYLSSLEIVRLESAPPTLEDLFIRHYEGQGAGR
jgi:ABC-2 type transport system ATP-binding protein